jgi:hypothetical protein
MMKIAISNPHDRFFKELFSREGKSLIVNYLPREILDLIDPDSAELVKDSFTDSELGEYFSDMIYKVRLKDGSTAHIYILFEHKSYSDPMAGFQILCYMVRIWEKIIRNHEEAKKAARKEGKNLPDEPPFRLPRILPVLICHRKYRWNVPENFVSLFDPLPEMDPYTPDFRYLLCDLVRYSDAEIKGTPVLKAGMLLMKYIFSDRLAERLPGILGHLRDIAATRTGLEFLQTAVVYLTRGTDKINKEELGKAVFSAFPETGGEIMATVAEQWIQEGKAEGRDEGRDEGEVGKILLAQRILKQMFYSEEELKEKNLDELKGIFSELEAKLPV